MPRNWLVYKLKTIKMYQTLLALHSVVRWFVIISLLYATFKAYQGWLGNKAFTKQDNSIRHWTTTICHVQLMIGIALYYISPIVNALIHNFNETVHVSEIRFYGMEHSLLMFIFVVIITIGSMKAKRKLTDTDKFKTQAIWFSIGLFILLLLTIMLMTSPVSFRPMLRMF